MWKVGANRIARVWKGFGKGSTHSSKGSMLSAYCVPGTYELLSS